MKNGKKLMAVSLAAALTITSVGVPNIADAAKKATLKTKKVTLYSGAAAKYSQKKLTVKNVKIKKVKFVTSNKKVAKVTKKGVVKAGKKAGKATITVKYNGKKIGTCKVTVKKVAKKIKSITLNKKSVTVKVGKTVKVKVKKFKPAKPTLKAVSFTSKNKKVAKVSSKGVIKGIKKGSTTVTVKALDGSNKKATVKVTVKKATTTVTPTKAPVSPTTVPATTPAIAATTPAVTTAPTKAPTQAPTQAPTEAPTQAPTEAPTQAPTEVPENVVTYTIENGKEVSAKVKNKTYTAKANDATVALYNELIDLYAAKNANLESAYTKFIAKEVNAVREVAEGKYVTVTKAAGSKDVTVVSGKTEKTISVEETKEGYEIVSGARKAVVSNLPSTSEADMLKVVLTGTEEDGTYEVAIERTEGKVTKITATKGEDVYSIESLENSVKVTLPKAVVEKYEITVK